jgi:polyphosphate kinase
MMKKSKSEAANTTYRILNRELSLLDFQARVLEEAHSKGNPLLERLRFLSIFGSNMDEFFMVRVSGIRKQQEAHYAGLSPDGLTPREELQLIRKRSLKLYKDAYHCYQDELMPALDKAGVHILDYRKLTKPQRAKADAYFKDVIFPILTPLVLDAAHPFPHISNLSLNFAIVIKDPKGGEKFARLKVPATLPRLLSVKRSAVGLHENGTLVRHQHFVWLDQVIAANLGMLFPGMKVVESHPFRVIRDADLEIQEIEAEDLIESMRQSIKRRKFGSAVAIAIHENMPTRIRKLLTENLDIKTSDIYELSGTLDLVSLAEVYNASDRSDLKYPVYEPVMPYPFRNAQTPEEIFEIIAQKRILLHHPYDSFTPVVDFLLAAARDPQVLAIKQTLYRVGQNSPVVEALLEAAERGKQVAVLVELKARFDEESNIGWAKMLEQAGVHVVYGLVGLKIHCKVGMVVRREGEALKRYCHLATGNYNYITANFYEDIGIFTCDEEIAADVTDLFNYLTGYSTMSDYRKLLVAPVNLRERLEGLIAREVKHAQEGRSGHIILKVNSLVDPEMIHLLYQAAEKGVKIDLIVRGMCCLVPGSDKSGANLRVISVLGRYLEHSRIFYFQNGGKEKVFLGSADLMGRNLDLRVETVFPIENEEDIRYLRDEVLETYLRDTTSARSMTMEGDYLRLMATDSKDTLSTQEWLMRHAHGQKYG